MKHTHNHLLRPLSLLTVLALLAQSPAAVAADNTLTLTFSAGCTATEGQDLSGGFGGEIPDINAAIPPKEDAPAAAPCNEFTVQDPTTLVAPTVRPGDDFTVAIRIKNPGKAPVKSVRAWIIYDPATLSGKTLKIDPAFPQTVPGEAQFSQAEGYVKINATATSAQKDDNTLLALVTFTVLQTTADKTVLSFYDSGTTDASHTAITTDKGSMLSTPPGSLLIPLPPQAAAENAPATAAADNAPSVPAAETAPASSSSEVTGPVPAAAAPAAPSEPAQNQNNLLAQNMPAPAPSPAPATAPEPQAATQNPGIFPDLQVTNLRVTTQGGTAYLGWDALASSELAGYNVYYGATSGQYLQRKSLDRSETTLSIRGLPEGTVYFFAIRGVNPSGVETQFSSEVSVTIGQPQTSTAPLSASVITGPNGTPPKTGGKISGESGVGSWMIVLLGISAMIGTSLAVFRQRAAFLEPPHA